MYRDVISVEALFANGKTSMDKKLLKDILKWDVESWECALSLWEKNVNFTKDTKCLALGEWDGGLSLWLALKGCDVTCSDYELSEKRASELHDKYNIRSIVKYQDINAFDIPHENAFDVIIFKSILGTIGKYGWDKQNEVFRQVHKALKPGGKLLWAENMKGSPMHKIARKYLTTWGNLWRYPDMRDLDEFLKIYSKSEVHFNGFLAVFAKKGLLRDIFLKVDKSFFSYIIPANWKYIAYGIAEK